MSHLIQPFMLFGAAGCIKHGATTPKWRSFGFTDVDIIFEGNTDLAIFEPTGTEDGDEWLLTTDSIGYGLALLEYYTCCIWKATLRFTPNNDDHTYSGWVIINNVEIDRFDIEGSSGDPIDFVIDLNALGLMNRACGNLWEIHLFTTTGANFETSQMTLSIIDVTFGPPV